MTTNIETLEQRVRTLERELGRHQDILAIHDVLARYSRALDWIDPEMLEDVFFDDAEIDYGFFRGSGREFKPLLIDLQRSLGRRWHFTSQVKIKLKGDEAEVESYNLAVASQDVEPKTGAQIMQFHSVYIDRLARRDGKWGITYRKPLVHSSAVVNEVKIEGEFGQNNQIGTASPDHPDFRKLLPEY